MIDKRKSAAKSLSRNVGNATLESNTAAQVSAALDDERNPGSFFRVPGVPVPGKTYWSVSK